ncbi:hypothetical protein PZ938_07645 [Luteipulveratus sp. YIM 133132]|uniref:hypothetical protein n=1 Tax=Luteipulveratus flavus TaxID=3031728 RepID=UPI0023AFF514|nr:hypothetical protein [Luteipulveratus sp. YIM 133132]MDE9365475.1 hypothetical protein [Luteipulveratus sp. YIM 133132]
MTPDELAAAALTWLGNKSAGPDRDVAPDVAAAVVEFVQSLPSALVTPQTGADGSTTWDWSDRARLGATMLTARLIRRRNSTAGVEAFSEAGAVYVTRNDPDIAQMLRLGPYAPPRIG